jgi:predicted amidohydrolase YtcJ
MSRLTSAAIAITAALAAPGWALAQPVIYHNAKIITVNPRAERAEAVAVADGRIVGVGTLTEVRAKAGAGARMVDLGGKSLLPGFYDNHIHLGSPLQPWKYGGMIEEVPEWLRGADTLPKLQAAIAAQAARTPKGQWIVGEIPREEWPNTELPKRADFDKAAPDHPVAIGRGPHTLIVNTKALEAAKITRTTKPSGGEIVHDANGEPNGVILESARRVIWEAQPPEVRGGGLSADQQIANWNKFLVQLTSLGVTSVNVAGITPENLKHVQTLYDRHGANLPRMTVQLRLSPGYDRFNDPVEGVRVTLAQLDAIGDRSKIFTHPKLKMGAVKMSIDGGLSAPIFWSTREYENRPGFTGEVRIPDQTFAAVARRAHQLGWQLGIHTMGDAAVVMVVDEMEKIIKQQPRADHRHYLHHVAVLPPEATLAKMDRNDIHVASQPGFLLALGSYADEALEPEREATQQPSGSLLRKGIRVSYGSDAGPYGPITGIYAAVTRRGWNGVVHGPGEAVTVRDAIRMHTLEPAFFTFDETKQGSIEVGKVADFVVLDRDPLTVPSEDIQNLKVERTIIGGQEVFAR